jgi:hypothetical protein
LVSLGGQGFHGKGVGPFHGTLVKL